MALEKHAKSFLAVHGAEACIPKFHFALHLPWMLQAAQSSIQLLLSRRKHREIKMIANNIHKVTPTFERTILEDVWGRAFLGMKEPHAFEFPMLERSEAGWHPASGQRSLESSGLQKVLRLPQFAASSRGKPVNVETSCFAAAATSWKYGCMCSRRASSCTHWLHHGFALGQNRFQVSIDAQFRSVCKHPESMPASTAC